MTIIQKQTGKSILGMFFGKIGIFCALCIFAVIQIHALMVHGEGGITQVVKNTKENPKLKSDSKVDADREGNAVSAEAGRLVPMSREQLKQQLAEMIKRRLENTVKKPSKLSLGRALLDFDTYTLIHEKLIHDLDEPYGKLYKQLGLDNGKLQQLRKLLADKEIIILESYELVREAKLPFNSHWINSLRDESDAAIRELLGDAQFSYYKNYENTLGSRNHVDILEKRLSYRSEPLTAGQYEEFVIAMAALPTPQIRPDSGAWLGFYTQELSKESLEIAKDILTPSQFAVYLAEYENMQTNIMLTEKYEKKFSDAEKERRKRIQSEIAK
jgi:hypothetical protein